MCLAQGHNQVLVGFKTKTFSLVLDTLPLGHCAPTSYDL